MRLGTNTPLFRLIHITDLHFDEQYRPLNQLYRVRMGGWQVHDPDVVCALAEKVAEIRDEDSVPCRVAVTGDLTTWGTGDAFEFALNYIRRTVPITTRQVCGLNDERAIVIPGNHDAWIDTFPLFYPRTGRPNPYGCPPFAEVFHNPAPDADLPLFLPGRGGPAEVEPPRLGVSPFPFRVCLRQANPTIYLYGLDSTRLDLWPEDEEQKAEKPWNIQDADPDMAARIAASLSSERSAAIAGGYIDRGQLRRLAAAVRSEPHQSDVVLRLVLIHHPLAYPFTNPRDPANLVEGAPPHWGSPLLLQAWHWFHLGGSVLFNMADVQKELYDLQFNGILCGHQHCGFTKPIFPQPDAKRPLYVLSAGTAAQAMRLPRREAAALEIPFKLLPNDEERELWYRAAAKTNEFRVYEFYPEYSSQGKLQIGLLVRVFRYLPSIFSFEEHIDEEETRSGSGYVRIR